MLMTIPQIGKGVVMKSNETQVQQTQHAILVAWGWFANQIGLVQQLEAVGLQQKRYHHTPQTKVLEFLVAILAGVRHLQEISLAAHPLDKDQAVAEAWRQPAWADYTGVSRTLRGLSWDEVRQIVAVLAAASQPYIEAEVKRLRGQSERLCLDGDLTGLPVSNTSRTYPNAAFGHMDDAIRLGYQAGVVSLKSPTYGRLWLSIAHHPGDVVSSTQAEALVLAAEAALARRPQRRTALLVQRIQACEQQMSTTYERLEKQQRSVEQAQVRLWASQEEQRLGQQQLAELTGVYQTQQRPVRPTSRLAQMRTRLQATAKRLQSRQQALDAAQRRLAKSTAHWQQQQGELHLLQQRLSRFEQDNRLNPDPLEAQFRLDAGFGTYDNIALLIEMGYEVYTKPYSHRLVAWLQAQFDEQTAWQRVGANAELVAWPNRPLKGCPYPVDIALQRFYTGKTRKHSALLHFGSDPVTQDLPGWFAQYNARQTIEAGIKENKQVFYLHHLKVRSEPAIYLQEAFVIFAANFIRWASHWLAEHANNTYDAFDIRNIGVKRQVHVAAHVSAQVIRNSEGRLLRFNEQSVLAGKILWLPYPSQRLPSQQIFSTSMPLFVESHLIAQPLR
jgi:hypothetical protein